VRSLRSARPWSPPSSAFAGFRFPPEVIVVAVRWYLRSLSYRDVEELLVPQFAHGMPWAPAAEGSWLSALAGAFGPFEGFQGEVL
jgi:hypothetical protein